VCVLLGVFVCVLFDVFVCVLDLMCLCVYYLMCLCVYYLVCFCLCLSSGFLWSWLTEGELPSQTIHKTPKRHDQSKRQNPNQQD